ncbi:MAG: hypothetical protein K2Q22_12900, partial [Cytophagales bacterium]|nr:hypothetical protein [Cytophagales bacterium]
MWGLLRLNFQWVTEAIVLTFLVGIRWYFYRDIGFVNFDSAFSVVIAQQISRGDFSQMFNHAAPLLHLVNGALYRVFNDWQILKLFHVLVYVGAIYHFSNTFRKVFQWEFPAYISYLLVFGTSLFTAFSSFYVSLEPLSVLFFAIILRIVLYGNFPQDLRALAITCSALLLVNYKFLPVVVPVVAVSQLAFGRKKWQGINMMEWVRSGVIFSLPILMVMVLGTCMGKPWYVYPGSIYVHAVARTIHPALTVAHWNFDFEYYPSFLFQYEQPLLIPLIVWFGVLYYRKRNFSMEINSLVGMAFLFLLGMAFVQKAPRGLLFCYPLIYAFAITTVLWERRLKAPSALVALMLMWNVYAWDSHLVRYFKTSYPQMADKIRQLGISSVSITSSSLILPFLDQNVHSTLLKNDWEGKRDTSRYWLVDTY